jgi:hypothetical protein
MDHALLCAVDFMNVPERFRFSHRYNQYRNKERLSAHYGFQWFLFGSILSRYHSLYDAGQCRVASRVCQRAALLVDASLRALSVSVTPQAWPVIIRKAYCRVDAHLGHMGDAS